MMGLRCPALKAAAVLLSIGMLDQDSPSLTKHLATNYLLSHPSLSAVLGSPACSGAGVDSWTNVPSTVKKFQRALSTSFSDRTALLLGTVNGVVGGTGTTASNTSLQSKLMRLYGDLDLCCFRRAHRTSHIASLPIS